MRGHGTLGRGKWLGRLFLILMMLAGGVFLAGEEGAQEGPKFLEMEAGRVRIKIDRTMGLVPLRVRISGDLRTRQQDAALAPDQHVFVEVESSFVRVVGADRSRDLGWGGVAEIDSAGVEHPMDREILIQRPGTYRFRLIVRDEDGNQLFSNKVKVKAM